jgi:16S rRNA (guanine527-N7)-methyltransferase
VPSALQQHIIRRLEFSGVPVPAAELLEKHELYLSLLAKWTKTINLTALKTDPPSDEAIDRLLVEPIAASAFAGPVQSIIDLGTGGGSPAIPFWNQVPGSQLTMIESRSRKCAFLREAVRQIGPGRGVAFDVRFEEVLLKHPELAGTADIVTMRAVRLDEPTTDLVAALLKPDGRVFRVTSTEEALVPTRLQLSGVYPLTKGTNSILQILRCSTWNNS